MTMRPIVAVFFKERATGLARKNGENCQLWYDSIFGSALSKQDKKYGTKLEDEYLKLCHELEVIVRPLGKAGELKVECRCSPINRSSIQCDCKFTETIKEMQNILDKETGYLNEE